MWMINPQIMCRRHLLGEHNEIHKFIGHLRRSKRIDGYIKNNLISPTRLVFRHEKLVEEMLKRGYHHHSEVDGYEIGILSRNYPDGQWDYIIDIAASLDDLHARCPMCKHLYEEGMRKIGRMP